MQRANLEELGTTEFVVTSIYGWSTNAFIPMIIYGLGNIDARALSFYPEFYAQYIQLVMLYNIGSLATMLVKNIGSSSFGE